MEEKKVYSIEELMQMGLSLDDIKELVGEPTKELKLQATSESPADIMEKTTKAAGLGLLQGATFGFGDELLEKAGMPKEEFEAIKAQDPTAFTVGELGGAVLTPIPGLGAVGKAAGQLVKTPMAKELAKGAVAGAVAGGLQALGDAPEKTLEAALEGAELGGAAGAAVPLVGKIVPAAIEKSAKFAVPSPIMREKMSDVFTAAKEKIKEGVDITSKEFIKKNTEETFQATKNFIEDLLESISEKRKSLYAKVQEIAEKNAITVPAQEFKAQLKSYKGLADARFLKDISNFVKDSNELSYKKAQMTEEALDRYIRSEGVDNTTRNAAIELKKTLKNERIQSLPEEGQQALRVADDFYQRVAGVDPETGEALGDFYAAFGKGVLDLSTYDQGKRSEEIVRMANKLMQQGSGLKYYPSDIYTTHLKNVEDLIKESGVTPEKSAELTKQWENLKQKLDERGLFGDVFSETYLTSRPSLTNIDPVASLTRLAYGPVAEIGKFVGTAEKKLEPISKTVAKPLYDIVAGNPEKIQQKIAELEAQGRTGAAKYLQSMLLNLQQQRAETPKISKLAAQQYVSSQNPGLKEILKDIQKKEEEE